MIRAILAISSTVVRSVLKEIILNTKSMELVGEAISYDSLKSMTAKLYPDVLMTDVAFFEPVKERALRDGAGGYNVPSVVFCEHGYKPEFFSKILRYITQPDFIKFTPQKIDEYSEFLEQLILDIKCSVLFENHLPPLPPSPKETNLPLACVPRKFSKRSFKAVFIGVSTGGPLALQQLLTGIGKNFPLPIFITQHIDSYFDKNLISWLGKEASVPVLLAENGMEPLPGHVYFAPSDAHLTVKSVAEDTADDSSRSRKSFASAGKSSSGEGVRLALDSGEPVNFLRPAVDKMFQSAAEVYGGDCIAVVLTGMGTDGAKECRRLKNLGAYTIAQDEASSMIYGMPKAAVEGGGICEVLPLNKIAERLRSLAGE